MKHSCVYIIHIAAYYPTLVAELQSSSKQCLHLSLYPTTRDPSAKPNSANLQPLRPSLLFLRGRTAAAVRSGNPSPCEEQLDLVNSIPFKNQCICIRDQGQPTLEIFEAPKYDIWYHPCTAKLSYILPRITRTATDHLLTLRNLTRFTNFFNNSIRDYAQFGIGTTTT